MKRPWTAQERELLMQQYANTPTAILAARLGRSIRQVYGMADRLGLKKSAAYLASASSSRFRSGHSFIGVGQFKPGQTPWNKGIRYDSGGRSAETRFKPGAKPHTWNPVGHERVSNEGYLQRKITDTGVTRKDYVAVHHLVWKEAGRTIPPGHALTFRDGDKRNFALENLELLSRADLMRRNSIHTYPKEVAITIHLRGVLNRKINQFTKEISP